MSEINIRRLHKADEIAPMVPLQAAIWDMPDVELVPLHMLIGAVHAGGLVLGAFDGDRMIGMSYAFPAHDENKRPFLWSHMTGVLAEYRDTGLGERIKWAQREHALAMGIDRISWTVDPLQGRNAALNVAKLGAVSKTYIVDLYAEMTDGINVGLPSDRLVMDWWITSERVAKRHDKGRHSPDLGKLLSSGAVQILDSAEPENIREPTGQTVLVEIPADIGAIKAADRDLALKWRLSVRRALQKSFAKGYAITEFISTRTDSGRRNFFVLTTGRFGANAV